MNTSALPTPADHRRHDRVRWRARRGLLELDLILTRFLDSQLNSLSDNQLSTLEQLLQLEDNDFLDLLMQKSTCNDPTLALLIERINASQTQ
ncbi:MAG: succinate dehydrogenase assembly factor 2 [Betaproteobacteria bacterium]|nr:succinate dehydrogenase assembly factor 2 [Betaproteobacteria bacterium]